MVNTVRNMNESKFIEVRQDIRKKLGQAFHILQDFYSHTNWVEMGKHGINMNIGATKSLSVKIAKSDMAMCKDCTQMDMQHNESVLFNEIWKKWNDSLLLPDFAVNNKWVDFDRVYICRNNVVNGEHLTSGYYGGEEVYAEKPDDVMKCSHGGVMDTTVEQKPRGGISKDADSMFFAPHYYLHGLAANLSVQATVGFLENFRVLLKDEHKFGLLIGVNITSTNIVHLDPRTNRIFIDEMHRQAMHNPKFIVYKNVDVFMNVNSTTNAGEKIGSSHFNLISVCFFYIVYKFL